MLNSNHDLMGNQEHVERLMRKLFLGAIKTERRQSRFLQTVRLCWRISLPLFSLSILLFPTFVYATPQPPTGRPTRVFAPLAQTWTGPSVPVGDSPTLTATPHDDSLTPTSPSSTPTQTPSHSSTPTSPLHSASSPDMGILFLIGVIILLVLLGIIPFAWIRLKSPSVSGRRSPPLLSSPPVRPEPFDVFLCYNQKDKAQVREIAKNLQQHGITPWLDEWELQPGLPWQRQLEQQIKQVKSAAVFVGASGIGPWQRREVETLLNEFVERGCPVIPVLLNGVLQKPDLPPFLLTMTWVDFRSQNSDPIAQLIWGITGHTPERVP